jgi:hypothetical protein
MFVLVYDHIDITGISLYSPIQCSPFKSNSPPISPPMWYEYLNVIRTHINEYFHQFNIPFLDLLCLCPHPENEERVDDEPSLHPIFITLLIEQAKFKASMGLGF